MNKNIHKELLNKIASEKNVDKQKIRIIAIINDYVKKYIQKADIIVVGGLAVEFYTGGSYMTYDIDIVASGHEKIMNCLVELGFTRNGKDAFREDLKTSIEIPNNFLSEGEIGYKNASIINTIDNFSIKIISPEVAFCDRVSSVINWNEEYHIEWLTKIYENFKSNFDWEQIYEILENDGVKKEEFLVLMNEIKS